MMPLPPTCFFTFKTSESLVIKLPLWSVWYPKPPNIPFFQEWFRARHGDTFPSFIPMLWACHKNTAKAGHLHPYPSFVLQFSSLPPDLHGPVIPICPSVQFLGIIVQVFLQANKLTLQFRHLGKVNQEAVLLLKPVNTIFHHQQQ